MNCALTDPLTRKGTTVAYVSLTETHPYANMSNKKTKDAHKPKL